jgi:hypothetical protein
VHVDVDRPDRVEEAFGGLTAGLGLRIVLDVVLDEQRVERAGVAGPERLEQPPGRLLVALERGRAHCGGSGRASARLRAL